MKRYGVRIESATFVARIEVEDQLVVMAAPIVKYMRGWSPDRAAAYCRRRRWTTLVMA